MKTKLFMIKNRSMKLKSRIFVAMVLTCLLNMNSQAQVDPHFSQYYVYPSWLNPALTGAFDGQYRVSGIYRNQWGNVSSPFSTPGASVDFTTNNNINFGGSFLSQKAGEGGYSYTTAYGNVAYTGVKFGPMQAKRLVFGIQAGMIQRKFDPTKMTFGDQWNPVTGFSPTNPTADVFSQRTQMSFDAGAGVMYYDAMPGKKTNLFAGFAVSHLTRPDDKFQAFGTARIPMRYTAHAGLRISVNDVFSITPNALYLRQGTAQETMIGAYAQYKAAANTDFMIGANYRVNDAISPFIGFTFKNTLLSAAYDVNISDLGRLAKGTNSFEISLTFIGRKRTKTPEVEFVCPRL
jgi:type IX secretion system PorP/SprF family membrane protein